MFALVFDPNELGPGKYPEPNFIVKSVTCVYLKEIARYWLRKRIIEQLKNGDFDGLTPPGFDIEQFRIFPDDD